MNVADFFAQVVREQYYQSQIAHVEVLPARPARYGKVPGGLRPAVQAVLARQEITHLYSHQAEAIGHLREGHNVVIVTGTASGKTLCYNLPVLEALLADPQATMLYLFPTKALAQDQLRALGKLRDPEQGLTFLAGTYDGDTPQTLRRKLRDGANVILTNPDMLHQGILPQHGRWNRFFTHLRYIVIDEVHAYRGVFGSHLANVMRRLKRVCRHYGSSPQIICCSATIANPQEHAARIAGEPMEVVSNDGSPRGPKRFVLWNPPPLRDAAWGDNTDWRVGGDRRSPLWEGVHLMTSLVRQGVQTIAFVRTRLAAELIFRNSRDLLRPVSPRLAEAVHAYRGGYLPEERREIERRLVGREILGVASTNALELGIDIGSLDACLLVGYPGAIASLWQQAGRAGRGREESLIVLIGQNSPIDQYLMAHYQYLFAQSPEHAVIDPDNPHITVGHLRCATHELPLADEEAPGFGGYAEPVLELLEEDNWVKHIDGRWYWASREYPAAQVNLRNISGPVYTIQEEREGERVIGTMDEVSALSQLHTHAVYLHGADTYLVTHLDIEQKIAHVERQDLDYYTQSIQASQIQVDEAEEQADALGCGASFGDVTVTTTIPMFKKIRFHSRESLGYEKLELPPQLLETVAMWLVPPEAAVRALAERKLVVGEALIGLANLLVEVAPMFVLCDPRDVGTVVDASALGKDALFLYDRYPGGMGYARRCLDHVEEILRTMNDVLSQCGCEDGCPSCVGSAVPAFALTDLDSAVRDRIPSKQGARLLLARLLEGKAVTTEGAR
jgi:DEAD/DEAH box helicase domain-containing protein